MSQYTDEHIEKRIEQYIGLLGNGIPAAYPPLIHMIAVKELLDPESQVPDALSTLKTKYPDLEDKLIYAESYKFQANEAYERLHAWHNSEIAPDDVEIAELKNRVDDFFSGQARVYHMMVVDGIADEDSIENFSDSMKKIGAPDEQKYGDVSFDRANEILISIEGFYKRSSDFEEVLEDYKAFKKDDSVVSFNEVLDKMIEKGIDTKKIAIYSDVGFHDEALEILDDVAKNLQKYTDLRAINFEGQRKAESDIQMVAAENGPQNFYDVKSLASKADKKSDFSENDIPLKNITLKSVKDIAEGYIRGIKGLS